MHSTAALQIMADQGDSGPIQPCHIHKAFVLYKKETGSMVK